MKIEQELGELTGSIQTRWVDLLSPVVFVLHNSQELVALANISEARGFDSLLENAAVSEALAEQMPSLKLAEFLKSHIPRQAEKKVAKLASTVLSSALVFGHAVLEDVAMQTLALSQKHVPEYFYNAIGDKSIKIKEARSHGIQELLENKVQDWLKTIERDTLLAKMKALFSCLQPDAKSILKGYAYDESRLIEIDNLRHQIVHKNATRAVTYDDLEFLRCTSIFTAGMLQVKVGISVKSLFDGMKVAFSGQDVVVGGPQCSENS